MSKPQSATTGKNPGFDFEIAHLMFQLEAIDLLTLPRENKGNVLRGAFGTIFKRLCCGAVCTQCAVSPMREQCAYAAVFEPSPPANSDRLSNLQDIPRPFVFRPPTDTRTRYEPGDLFEFELLLFGKAKEYLAYFIVAFRELAESGFGIGRGRCRLKLVTARTSDEHNSEVYSCETQSVLPISDCFRAAELMKQPPGQCRTLRVDYLTPTHIKNQGVVVESPSFHHLVKRLRDRVNALAWFYHGTLLDIDFAEFGRRAERVQTVDSRIHWVDRDRLSTRTNQRHSIGGFIGYAIYSGELGEFIPLLQLGEHVHVGKHAVWGNGRFQTRHIE